MFVNLLLAATLAGASPNAPAPAPAVAGNRVTGEKQGFCFEDNFKYGSNPSAGYSCENQGITSGWGDWYYKQLAGQWIDITGLPEGDYFVSATINKAGLFDEGEDRYPNVVVVKIHIPDPRNKVDGTWHD